MILITDNIKLINDKVCVKDMSFLKLLWDWGNEEITADIKNIDSFKILKDILNVEIGLSDNYTDDYDEITQIFILKNKDEIYYKKVLTE